VFEHDVGDLPQRLESEQLEESLDIRVFGSHEELVELERRAALRLEPDGVAGRLAELAA
jgi:hypothetical protein